MIRQYRLVTPAIASNVATVTSEVLHGEILSVEINYPAGTCTVDLNAQEGVVHEILNLAAANTDRVIYPRTPAQDETGADRLFAAAGTVVPVPHVVHGRLKLDIAAGTNGEIITVFINVRE